MDRIRSVTIPEGWICRLPVVDEAWWAAAWWSTHEVFPDWIMLDDDGFWCVRRPAPSPNMHELRGAWDAVGPFSTFDEAYVAFVLFGYLG